MAGGGLLVLIVTSEGGSSNLVMQSIKAQRVHAAHYVLCYANPTTAAVRSSDVTRYVLYRPPPENKDASVLLLPAGCVDDDEKDVATRVTKVPVPERTPPLLQVKAAMPVVEAILRDNPLLWVLISVDASAWSPARMEMYHSVLSTEGGAMDEVSGFRPTTRGYFEETLATDSKVKRVVLKDAADARLFDLLAVRSWVFLSFLRNKSDDYLAHRYAPLGYIAHVYTWSIKKQKCLPKVITFTPKEEAEGSGGGGGQPGRVIYVSVPQPWEAPPVPSTDVRDLVDRALFTTRMDDLLAAVKDKRSAERAALQHHLEAVLGSMDVDDVDSVVEDALWAALE
jgi:hypothetical protein